MAQRFFSRSMLMLSHAAALFLGGVAPYVCFHGIVTTSPHGPHFVFTDPDGRDMATSMPHIVLAGNAHMPLLGNALVTEPPPVGALFYFSLRAAQPHRLPRTGWLPPDAPPALAAVYPHVPKPPPRAG